MRSPGWWEFERSDRRHGGREAAPRAAAAVAPGLTAAREGSVTPTHEVDGTLTPPLTVLSQPQGTRTTGPFRSPFHRGWRFIRCMRRTNLRSVGTRSRTRPPSQTRVRHRDPRSTSRTNGFRQPAHADSRNSEIKRAVSTGRSTIGKCPAFSITANRAPGIDCEARSADCHGNWRS